MLSCYAGKSLEHNSRAVVPCRLAMHDVVTLCLRHAWRSELPRRSVPDDHPLRRLEWKIRKNRLADADHQVGGPSELRQTEESDRTKEASGRRYRPPSQDLASVHLVDVEDHTPGSAPASHEETGQCAVELGCIHDVELPLPERASERSDRVEEAADPALPWFVQNPRHSAGAARG
jgi:hypothetical protein